MTEINDTNTVTINDLKKMGREGDVTARLESGEIVTLRPTFCTKTCQGIIAGIKQEVEVVLYYSAIYQAIRTVKRGDILVARKIKRGGQSVLQLTGKGYCKSTN